MIAFRRSFDFERIREVMTHPQIYPHISDDASPAPAEFKPLESRLIWYIEARDIDPDGPAFLGYWVFHPHNSVCWEVHTCLLPSAWGPIGQQAARELPAWMWTYTPCRRIITNVPTSNRLALHFAFKAGMKMYGVNEASFLKDGVLNDQVCLGISAPSTHKEVEVCQQQPQLSPL